MLVGQPTRYGQAEPWKLTKEMIGRTKVSRAPENQSRHPKNDGRKFNTEKELLGKPSKKRNASNSKSKTKKPPPIKKKPRRKGRKSAPKDSDSYEPDGDDEDDTPLKGSAAADTDGSVPDVETHTPMNTTRTNPDSRDGELPNTASVYTLGTKWANNSCWLDTSLQALYASVVRDTSFQLRLNGIEENLPMSRFFKYINSRKMISQPLEIVTHNFVCSCFKTCATICESLYTVQNCMGEGA